jgi:phosphoglycerate dehydrogenase-like enzyme
MTGPRVALAPEGAPRWVGRAIEEGGGTLVPPEEAEAVVWFAATNPKGLPAVLERAPHARWVQLPWAGVEPYVDLLHDGRTWTCGKGVYAEPVAEHALALALAGMRGLDRYARAGAWTTPRGRNLLGARVTILGGGGIAESLVRLLGPFGCEVTVVRNQARPMEGAARVVAAAETDAALAGAELVVLALALTPETRGVIDRRRLALLSPGACLVNVARGEHVVTADLVDALGDGTLGSAGLDVTDPEPLPDGHPLWSLPNAIVTPHTANTPEMALPLLTARVAENVRRRADGEPLLGQVDPARGY